MARIGIYQPVVPAKAGIQAVTASAIHTSSFQRKLEPIFALDSRYGSHDQNGFQLSLE